MLQKVRLHDCCGAQHIFGFGYNPHEGSVAMVAYPVPQANTWGSTTIRLTPERWLEVQMMPHNILGHIIEHNGARYRVHTNNPGITTAVITGAQNRLWGPVLTRLGFKLTVNNILNKNSGNQLFFYTRIEAPLRSTTPWLLDGQSYFGRVRLGADGVTPYRVRNRAGALVHLQPNPESQQLAMVI